MKPRPLRSTVRWLAIAAASISACSAAAIAQSTDGHCDGAAFGDDLGLAQVKRSQQRVSFVKGALSSKTCPSDAGACRDKPFLMPGDTVLTSGTKDGFVCGTFVNTRTIETIGWLPAAALGQVAAAPVALGDWPGTWKRIEAEIKIKSAAGGKLSIEGTAVWGSFDKGRVARGAVQNGEISGTASPSGDVVFISDEPAPSFEKVPASACAVRMRRLGPYLIVEDNKSCGGMNVSFSGIYVKR